MWETEEGEQQDRQLAFTHVVTSPLLSLSSNKYRVQTTSLSSWQTKSQTVQDSVWDLSAYSNKCLLKDSYGEVEELQGADTHQNRADVEYYHRYLDTTPGTYILSFQVHLNTSKDQMLSHYKYINLIKSKWNASTIIRHHLTVPAAIHCFPVFFCIIILYFVVCSTMNN